RTGRGGRTLQGKGATASPNETVAPGLGSWTLELPAPHLDDALRRSILEERPHILHRDRTELRRDRVPDLEDRARAVREPERVHRMEAAQLVAPRAGRPQHPVVDQPGVQTRSL